MGHNKVKTVKTPTSKDRAERVTRRCKRRQSSTTTQTTKISKNDQAQNVDHSHEHGVQESSVVPDTNVPPEVIEIPSPDLQESQTESATALFRESINITELSTKLNAQCQTDLSSQDISNMEDYIITTTGEIVDLKKNVIELETKVLQSALTKESFTNNDAKTKFYTGLPNFAIMMAVFNLVAPSVIATSRNCIPKFSEYILTLMRLRLNLPLQDLAYRFKVSLPTAGRIFEKWVDAMSDKLGFLIWWPEREELGKTMPRVFKRNFGNRVAVIIDCFEVFIDRPSSLIARAMTWSNYKHHNTVKFLIGITPQGVISFISQAWGGRVSDKYLTENSGLLKNLLPGDIVLADRGFDISDSVGLCQASLKIPAFTRGKNQLSALDVEETRKIANVRIHVERVIGLVRRKYTILQTILPIEFVTARHGKAEAPIDKIARVCCALTNLSDSVIPLV
ncbi:uncharacterized protein LOC111343402 [Stylophora pistillata]|uniref:uncharacterized protein LOC111343402 n=1 Tax=Stylophora pistillata TaxID=50429 RepID=UPI000C03AF0D|nr:uncharacterized protein LOC111343402 [Stylophora pistillata]